MGARGKLDDKTLERSETVLEMIIRGASRAKIIKYCNHPEKLNWNVDSRTIDNYIKHAKQIMRDNNRGTKKDFVALAMNRYNDLYQKNYSAEDYRECRGVQDSLNKLLGINEPEKTDVTTKGESLNKGFGDFLKEVATVITEDDV